HGMATGSAGHAVPAVGAKLGRHVAGSTHSTTDCARPRLTDLNRIPRPVRVENGRPHRGIWGIQGQHETMLSEVVRIPGSRRRNPLPDAEYLLFANQSLKHVVGSGELNTISLRQPRISKDADGQDRFNARDSGNRFEARRVERVVPRETEIRVGREIPHVHSSVVGTVVQASTLTAADCCSPWNGHRIRDDEESREGDYDERTPHERSSKNPRSA